MDPVQKGKALYGFEHGNLVRTFQRILSPLSPIYEKVLAGRASLYRLGLLSSRKLSVPVISVGNIITGGTGKTPLVIKIVQELSKEEIRFAVLSRGYRGKAKKTVNIVSDTGAIHLGPQEAGDEPYLMAQQLPGTPVLVGKDRYALGQEAISRFQVDCLILDDGFQHLPLKRDADLLLLDGRGPFGKEQCLPGGDMREGIPAIQRADIIVVTGSPSEAACSRIAALSPGTPIHTVRFVPTLVALPLLKKRMDLSTIKGRRVAAFAGIARTERFFRSLEEAGAIVCIERSFPDHHPYSGWEIERLSREAVAEGADYLITTEKDLVRIPAIPSSPALLTLQLSVEIDNPEGFFQEIRKRIQPGRQAADNTCG
jgi:tetraacyldisaccharide 4'-kinase